MKHTSIFSFVRLLLWLCVVSIVGIGCQSDGGDSSSEHSPNDMSAAESARVCLATAKRLEQGGCEKEAIREYERARAFDPSLASVSRRLCVLYDRQGDDAHALAEYRVALAQTPEDAELLNDLGYFYYSRDEFPEAERRLREAVHQRPSYQRAWVNLGMVLAQQRRYDESLDAFGKAVSPAQAKSNLGIILAGQGEYHHAEEELRQALALDATLPQCKVVLAWVESRLSGNSFDRPLGTGQLAFPTTLPAQ